jgi:hypothetical protein
VPAGDHLYFAAVHQLKTASAYLIEYKRRRLGLVVTRP